MAKQGIVGLVAALALCAAGVGAAEEKKVEAAKAARPEPAVSALAEGVLRGMGDYLAASTHLSFHADISFDDLLASGQKIQLSASNDVVVRRPDRIYSEYVGDSDSKHFWFDGKDVTLYDPRHNVYGVEKGSTGIDATLDHVTKTLGFTPPLADLMYANPYEVLRRSVEFGFYVGLSHVAGTRCHHLAFVEQVIDWQIWIEDGTQWVPRKLVITYKTLPGAPQFEAVFSKWDLVTRTPDALFKPVLPPDAARIAFGSAARGASAEGGQQ